MKTGLYQPVIVIISKATFSLRCVWSRVMTRLWFMWLTEVVLHTVSAMYLTLCFLQERFQVKNPPHTYIQKLKGYLDPAVTRKVRWMCFRSWLLLLEWAESCIRLSFCQSSRQRSAGDHQQERTKGKKVFNTSLSWPLMLSVPTAQSSESRPEVLRPLAKQALQMQCLFFMT